jgi:hypothetical protein
MLLHGLVWDAVVNVNNKHGDFLGSILLEDQKRGSPKGSPTFRPSTVNFRLLRSQTSGQIATLACRRPQPNR